MTGLPARLRQVLSFRDDGAPWGLVVLDQAPGDRAKVVTQVRRAIEAWIARSGGFATPLAPAAAAGAEAAAAVDTVAASGPAAGSGASGSTSPTTTVVPAPTPEPAPAPLPAPVTVPTLPPVTLPPVPTVPLSSPTPVDDVITVIGGAVTGVSG
jgi:hypothetical protein